MSTKTLIAVVALLGVVVFMGGMAWRQRARRAAELDREQQGIEIERLEQERRRQQERLDAITDGGAPGRFYGRADAGRGPCPCQPGDPLCACL